MQHAKSSLAIGLGLSLLAALPTTGSAQASASDVIQASLTVESEIDVAAFQDLLFGSHFASEGSVEQVQSGIWGVGGDPGTVVDLSFTILPTELLAEDGSLFAIPLTYDPESMAVQCYDGVGLQTLYVDPTVGIVGCSLSPSEPSGVAIGHVDTPEGAVRADLSADPPPGLYVATIELTAVVN
ncbi:MAG TPA: hypothetical protein VK837_06735 [Longimicrobiales bacterium]|nr:hypothetical protein [Longimicrobiales bacterium]